MADSTGPLIDGMTFALDGTKWDVASVGGPGAVPLNGDGLYFNGPNANAANNPIPIFSPDPWEEGSSGSHTDDGWYDGSSMARPKLLMNNETITGPGVRTLSAMIASASSDQTVLLWDTDTHKPVARLRYHELDVLSLAFSANDSSLVVKTVASVFGTLRTSVKRIGQ